jgi:PKD repeat protein
MKKILIFLLVCVTFSGSAQNIIEGEYFFDTEPGIGNGIPIIISVPGDTVTQNLSINSSGLLEGPHVFCLRVKNASGFWSHTISRSFYAYSPILIQPVTNAEYFFDTDPGIGNGTPITITATGDTVSQNLSINTTGLSTGPHIFCLRVKDAASAWSHTLARTFYIINPPGAIQPLTSAEYFFDIDPGVGNGTPLVISSNDTINMSFDLTNTFSSGTHYFVLRTKDAGGEWGLQLSKAYNVCATYGPKSIFDYVIDFNKVYFSNTSIYDQSHLWDFGDGNTDTTLYSPAHVYNLPGIYNAKLITYNPCAIDTLIKTLQVNGITSAAPKIATPNGFFMMELTGYGFNSSSQFKLWRPGFPDISPDSAKAGVSGNYARLYFRLNNADAGWWHLVVSGTAIQDTLFGALQIDTSTVEGGLELGLNVPERVARFRTNIFQVLIKNKGNTPVYSVPVYISNTKNGSTTSLSVGNPFFDSFLDSSIVSSGPPGRFYQNIDSATGDTSGHITAFMIPYLAAGESHIISLSYKTVEYGTDYITVVVKKPMIDETILALIGLHQPMSNCTWMSPCMQAIMDAAGVAPGVGCAVGIFDLACALGNYASDYDEGNPAGKSLFDLGLASTSTLLSCVTGLPGAKLLKLLNFGSKQLNNNVNNNPSPFAQCWNDITADSDTKGVTAFDPNEKTGPNGYALPNFIKDVAPLSYTITFENADTASAPAAEVVVTDTLDKTRFDLSTFEYSMFGWSDSIITLTVPSAQFAREFDLRPGKNTILRVSGSIDTASGIITTRFASYDPDTFNIVANPADGFLNPNIISPEGDGFLIFHCELLPGLNNLDVVNNKAEIVFDLQPAINTPVFSNTLDLNKPASSVLPITAFSDTTFTVHWSGSDAESGVKHFNIYVSENDSAYQLWQVRTPLDSGVFTGSIGSTYKFYSIAVDSVNNVEDAPSNPIANPDAQTTVVVGISEVNDAGEYFSAYPNPATNDITLFVRTHQQKQISVKLYSMQGAQMGEWMVNPNQKKNISLGNISPGIYHLEAMTDGKKILIKKLTVLK